MQAMFVAMSLYPEVQKKAQAELDNVVGPSRLPDFDDLESLTYIRAIIKESLRWHTVTPVGIPHRMVEDDFFRGYFVPAGSAIIANAWSVFMSCPISYTPRSAMLIPWTGRACTIRTYMRIQTSSALTDSFATAN